ncbi:MAG: MFS transporter [Candidatus Bathyarchaeia archaeon]
MRKAFTVFIMLGLVSLFADITYEGARSISGAYIKVLEGTGLVAGAIVIGEFLGYIMRFVSGLAADRLRSSRVLWLFTISGYLINLIAVPSLAFAGRWEIALALLFMERIGKGLRTPSRDVILSEVVEGLGRGKGFGLHEVMDQLGAFAGPIIVTLAITGSGGNYSPAFLVLSIPAIASIASLTIAATMYPRVQSISVERPVIGWGLGREFKLFSIALSLMTAGYLPWSIVSYHLKDAQIVGDPEIAMLYALAMAVDAIIAFPAGFLYDKIGIKSLIITPVAAALIPPALLNGSKMYVYSAAILWGVVMGIYETSIRAAIPGLVHESKRAFAYGVYGLIYGTSWMLGGLIIGALHELNPLYLTIYSALLEIPSITLIAYLSTTMKIMK